MSASAGHEIAMHVIDVAGYAVHIFQNKRGRFQWEPLGVAEPWPGSEEYGSFEEAERAAHLWGEDLQTEAGADW